MIRSSVDLAVLEFLHEVAVARVFVEGVCSEETVFVEFYVEVFVLAFPPLIAGLPSHRTLFVSTNVK